MPYTLKAPCSHLEIIQKSRFLVHASPISSPEQAGEVIRSLSQPDATHNCWAWKFGSQYRFSDDGEPGGTAGRPMLVAIEGQDLDRIVVLITRYFGGIKLGTGGLARAYGGSTSKCLQSTERIELIPQSRASLHCPFSELERFRQQLERLNGQVLAETFDAEGARLQISLPTEQVAPLQTMLASLTRGRSMLQVNTDASGPA